MLINKNCEKFGEASSIGFVFNSIGVGLISGGNAMCVYMGLHYIPYFEGRTSNWIAPCMIGGIEGMIIGIMVMSMFGFASETILMCFYLDEDINFKVPDVNTRPASFFGITHPQALTERAKLTAALE